MNEIFSYFSRATFCFLQRFAQHSSAASIPPLWLSDAISLFIKRRLFRITDRRMITKGEVAPISVEDTPRSLTFVPSLQSEPQLIRSLDTVFFKKLINGIINRRTRRINKYCACGSLCPSRETVSAVSLHGRKEHVSRQSFNCCSLVVIVDAELQRRCSVYTHGVSLAPDSVSHFLIEF